MRSSLSDRLALAGALTDIVYLDTFDDVWTSYLDDADPSDVELEQQALLEVTSRLLASIPRAIDGITTIARTLEEMSDDDVDAAFGALADNTLKARIPFGLRSHPCSTSTACEGW